MVEEANTVAGEHAMVISFDHANLAYGTMVGTGWGIQLADVAVVPTRSQNGGKHESRTSDCSVAKQHHIHVGEHLYFQEQSTQNVETVCWG